MAKSYLVCGDYRWFHPRSRLQLSERIPRGRVAASSGVVRKIGVARNHLIVSTGKSEYTYHRLHESPTSLCLGSPIQ